VDAGGPLAGEESRNNREISAAPLGIADAMGERHIIERHDVSLLSCRPETSKHLPSSRMNTRRAYLPAAAVSALHLACAGASAQVPSPIHTLHRDNAPVNVIFDTDIWSDIDDALALAVLHALEDRGEIKLLAVTISTNDRWCASYVNLVDTFYDHPHVPIGVNREGMDVEFFRKKFPSLTWPVTRYTQRLSERKKKNGTWAYPRRLSDGTTAPEAVALLRKMLAAQPDGSVVMIQVGYSTNLARLLKSPPDAISVLGGRELIARKVRLLSIMAGSFRETTVEGEARPKGSPEFNLLADVPSAQALFTNWPTPIVASGFEIGLDLPYPPESIEHDYAYVQDHPIAETYRTYCEELKFRYHWTCPHSHPTFDLTAVLYAVRPNRNYFSLSSLGKITVLDDGSSRFEEVPGGRDRYLILLEAQKARALEAMVMLASQPPTHRATP
jgi:purine nucleosidase